MLSSVKRLVTRRLCMDALLLGTAFMMSYLEALLPLQAFLPLPGFRLGLSQLVITLTFFCVGRADAAAVSAIRVLAMGLLFGNASSLFFSLCGSLLAYVGLWLGYVLLRSRCSYIGLGVLCAALHNLGQLLAAALLYGSGVFLGYLPAMLFSAVLFGGIGGRLLNTLLPRIKGGLKL